MYYHLLPIADVAANQKLSASFVACFSKVFTYGEVLAVANAVKFADFERFAAAFLQLAAAEKLSYVAVEDQEVKSRINPKG